MNTLHVMNFWRHLPILLLIFLYNSGVYALPSPAGSVELACEPGSQISQTFDNGASWDLCWESRIRENLVLSDIHYTPPDAAPLRVLASARLSQLHVAYDDSDVTYNDITQYGLGGGYLLTLTGQDCPQGDLLEVQSRAAICLYRGEADGGYRTPNRSIKAESLNLFSISQVGAYTYIISWAFYDDGAIKPEIGATGALQRSSAELELPYGRVLEGDPDTLWLSHTHNYHWRLDFDLGSSATDDRFSEMRYVLQADGTRERETDTYDTEQARRIDPDTQQHWQIRATEAVDSPAYRLEPVHAGHRFERKEVEPYTDYDLFVTVANDCERFASQNARFNPDCLNDVLEYVDGQSIRNEDIVLWYRVAFHHVPRNEDQRHMHSHWDGFVLQPHNILSGTSALVNLPNTTPVLGELPDRRDDPGDSVHGHVLASDPDDAVLTFTATGLPPGVSMNSLGHFQGQLTTAGTYDVIVVVRDDQSQASGRFTWQVGEQGNRKHGGVAEWPVLLVMASLLLWRRLHLPKKHLRQVRDTLLPALRSAAACRQR